MGTTVWDIASARTARNTFLWSYRLTYLVRGMMRIQHDWKVYSPQFHDRSHETAYGIFCCKWHRNDVIKSNPWLCCPRICHLCQVKKALGYLTWTSWVLGHAMMVLSLHSIEVFDWHVVTVYFLPSVFVPPVINFVETPVVSWLLLVDIVSWNCIPDEVESRHSQLEIV